jgi:hypothetical protein
VAHLKSCSIALVNPEPAVAQARVKAGEVKAGCEKNGSSAATRIEIAGSLAHEGAHATYVVARMHYAVTRMLDSGLLTKEEAVAAREARKRNRRLYADGLAGY